MTKFADLSQEQFDALVQAKVAEALSNRDEEDARRKSEEALAEARQTFENLKASLEARDTKIAEYEAILADMDTDPTAAEIAANDKIVELENSVSEWQRRAEVAEAALTTLALEEAAANRMAELEESGVALDEDDAVQTQYAKIRDMSDDEFDAYKAELVALKSKYASVSEEAGQDYVELSELSSDEVNMIAQSLGCDPADSKCIALVQEVAQKMAEVSKSRKKDKKKMPPFMMKDEEKCSEGDEPTENASGEGKETASTKLSFGEGLARAMDQTIQASPSRKEEIANEWSKYYEQKNASRQADK